MFSAQNLKVPGKAIEAPPPSGRYGRSAVATFWTEELNGEERTRDEISIAQLSSQLRSVEWTKRKAYLGHSHAQDGIYTHLPTPFQHGEKKKQLNSKIQQVKQNRENYITPTTKKMYLHSEQIQQ